MNGTDTPFTFEELISFKYAYEQSPVGASILIAANVAIFVTLLLIAF